VPGHRWLRILLEIGDAAGFKSSAHLAAYAGIAPVTRTSGSSIKGEHPDRTGKLKLKRAFFLSAFAALHDPTSRTYYHRKRAEGKKHSATLNCPARRRCDVLSTPCSVTTPTTDTPSSKAPGPAAA
jgi:transposase